MALPPDILTEWHPTRNEGIDPSGLSPGSSKKVWWFCEAGHEWRAAISKRALRGDRCAYCSGKRPSAETSLIALNPQLGSEWHPTKNGDYTPADFLPNSGKKVWWQCEFGHEWYAQIKSRNKGSGCPICSGRSASESNSFAALHPAILREWHPTKNGGLSPALLKPRSGKRIWWQCAEGHEWQATLHNRIGGTNCPYCSGRLVTAETSLSALAPQTAREWHPTKNGNLRPDEVALNYSKRVWWQCKKGHEWQVSPNSRVKGTGCPFCNSVATSRLELRIYTELKSLFKDVRHREKIKRRELDVFLPELNLGIEIDGAYWHRDKDAKDLQKNHAFATAGVDVLRLREGDSGLISADDIRFHTSEKHLPIIKRLIAVILRTKRDRIKSVEALEKYLKKRTFINSREYNMLMELLPSPPPGESLRDKNPELSNQWHPTRNGAMTPSDFTSGSGEIVWWLCGHGHEWKAQISSRNKDTGCPYCAGQRVSSDNCLQERNPRLAAEWHPTKNGKLTPADVTLGTARKVWWVCSAGHEWTAANNDRNRGNGCPTCGNRKRGDATRGTLKEMQAIAKERGGKCISSEYVTARKKLKWECAKGHTWEAVPDCVKNRGSWCPICAKAQRRLRTD